MRKNLQRAKQQQSARISNQGKGGPGSLGKRVYSTKGGPKVGDRLLTRRKKEVVSSPRKPKTQAQKARQQRRNRNRRQNENARKQWTPKIESGSSWWEDALSTVSTVAEKAAPLIIPLLMGAGDYELESNSVTAAATEGKLGGEVPQLSNSQVHNTISHREYLGDVMSTTSSFLPTEFIINPGVDGTFPWLGGIARKYQQYRIKGMVFEFRSLATSYAATAYIGFVCMATQYDSYDDSFVSKLEMENSEYSTSRKTDESFCHPIECARDQTSVTEMYVRDFEGDVGDKRLFDWGRLTVAVGGQTTDDTPIGELWCTYEIEFFKPKLADIGDDEPYFAFSTSTGIDHTHVLGTGEWVLSTRNTMEGVIHDDTFQLTGVSEGDFLIISTWQGSNTGSIDGITWSDGANCFRTAISYNPPDGYVAVNAMTQQTTVAVFTVTGPDPEFPVSADATMLTDSVSVRVIGIPRLPTLRGKVRGCFEEGRQLSRTHKGRKEKETWVEETESEEEEDRIKILETQLAIAKNLLGIQAQKRTGVNDSENHIKTFKEEMALVEEALVNHENAAERTTKSSVGSLSREVKVPRMNSKGLFRGERETGQGERRKQVKR